MPSVAISHVILTAALIVLFLSVLATTQSIVLDARVRFVRANMEELLDLVVSKIERIRETLTEIGSNTTIAIEGVTTVKPSTRSFYYIHLIEGDNGGVKVTIENVDFNIKVTSPEVQGVTLVNQTILNSIKDLLMRENIMVVDGRTAYTGAKHVILWGIMLNGRIYVGIGWSES